jgi:VanZ family protein|tara:strand:+ start:533 stop:955 length:423 start_codon:yes stop_codon:yes gene_type:complete
LITEKSDKINKIIMKKINNFLIKAFHLTNFVLIVFYLFPGSILGYLLYNNFSIQPQITQDFLISSNHFFVFIVLSIIGVASYQGTKKFNHLIKYLFFLSIFLEFLHIVIPNRAFEINDLFGNIMGVVVVIIPYKMIKKYE